MKDETNNIYPPAVVRALSILDYMAENPGALAIKDISDLMDIPPASAYRLVRCLLDFGYLRESPNQTDKYKIGYKPALLSKMAFDGSDLIAAANHHMRNLANETSQACQLCVVNDAHVITLDQTLPQSTITIMAKLGEPIQVNTSASGKVLFSSFPENKRRDILMKVWPTYKANTSKTITNLAVFLKELDRAAKDQYATDIEEFATGIGCVAVPIYDYSRNIIAAIGLTGPIENYRQPGDFQMMLQALREASRKISEDLSFPTTR